MNISRFEAILILIGFVLFCLSIMIQIISIVLDWIDFKKDTCIFSRITIVLDKISVFCLFGILIDLPIIVGLDMSLFEDISSVFKEVLSIARG